MRAFLVGCAALLTSCVTQSASSVFNIAYSYEDVRDSKSFNLEYENKSGKAVCVAPDNWPNSAGKIDQASSRIWVDIEGKRFGIKEFNTGYCPQCAARVSAGEELTGKIPYEEFEIPLSLYGAKKELHFQPVAFSCK